MPRVHPRYTQMQEKWDEQAAERGWQEYPMMVYPGSKDGGKTPDRHPTKPGVFLQEPVIVNNDEEKAAALAGNAELAEGSGVQHLRTEEDDRQELIAKLTEASVQFDKRWGPAKLQAAWDDHEASLV